MNKRFDLHSHSTASDGSLPPADLVRHAVAQRVDVLALTDHDTTEGLAEAIAEATPLGLQLIPGVEISVTWNNTTIHVVGLGVNVQSETLQTGLQGLRQFRDWRAAEIGRRLERSGVPDAYEGARQFASGGIISRTHFARYLVQLGRAKNLRNVFKQYLTRNKPGYVPGEWASVEQAVSWIRSAAGRAVIAHPARYAISASKLREFIGQFKECGGEALEVVSGSHSPADVLEMAAYARRFDLLASAGSDYHGPEDPWVELGKVAELPAGCTPVWQDWPDAA